MEAREAVVTVPAILQVTRREVHEIIVSEPCSREYSPTCEVCCNLDDTSCLVDNQLESVYTEPADAIAADSILV